MCSQNALIPKCAGVTLHVDAKVKIFLSQLVQRLFHGLQNDANRTCYVTNCIFPSVTPFFLLQLKDNIEKFFTKFVDEGKATVRLKEPAVDVCLSKVCISD